MASRGDLPIGSVTFLFTDIEGSTKLLHEIGEQLYAEALAAHRLALREAFGRHGGVEVDTQGDAFFFAFPTAQGAVDAAREGARALESGRIRVRVGIHTGEPHVTNEGYVGADVHKGARIGAAGHGGQILLSNETRVLVDADLTDLGEHRLKDFDAPVWIYQVGSDRFPPLKTISNTNLPRPVSSFVGREREVHELASLLEDARLVTLTGPGGSGKTRLAIEAAAERVPATRNGVFWVPLATVRNAADVIEEIGRTLGAKEGLAKHIGVREMLLLLDNFEQVVDAAPALGRLLEECPQLHLLVTSRELLRIGGEIEYAVLPLAEPEAVNLFCIRARVEQSDVITELCRRLDNLPLAIELAAARANVLSPAGILERLSERLDLLRAGRGADPRQATLRGAIEWSYELLDEQEGTLFARLAVFAGGCTLEAAERIVDADLDTIASLVDKSLVRRTGDRFWMLETIREFALERFNGVPTAQEIRRRHADWYFDLSVEAEPHIQGYMQEWIERLETEHDNIRAALDHYASSASHDRALRMAGALSDFWYYAGHVAEGLRRLQDALRVSEEQGVARAKALSGAADLAGVSGRTPDSIAWGKEALELYRELGNTRGVAYTQWSLAVMLLNASRPSEALPLIRHSVELYRDLGDEANLIAATRSLGWAYHELGHLQEARAIHEENLARARAGGFAEIVAGVLGSLTMIALTDGRTEDARLLAMDNLRVNLELGAAVEAEVDLSHAACVLAELGRLRVAAELLGAAEVAREELGVAEPWVVKMHEEVLAVLRRELAPGELEDARKRGRSLRIDDALTRGLEALE